MGDVPATDNKAAGIISEAFRKGIDASVSSIKAALVSSAPYLGWPVLSQLVDFLLKKIGNAFYEFLAISSTFVIIDLQTLEEKAAYLDSLEALRKAQELGDKGAEDEALKNAKEKLGRLIHWDGSLNK